MMQGIGINFKGNRISSHPRNSGKKFFFILITNNKMSNNTVCKLMALTPSFYKISFFDSISLNTVSDISF